MTRRYAENTKVEPEQSVAEIRKYAELRGAAGFTFAMGDQGGAIRFMVENRWVQFSVERDEAGPDGMQEYRRRWRVVLLKVKTAFEVLRDGGDTTVEEAFMPYLMLPDGRTVGDHVTESIPRIYAGELGPMDLFRPALGTSS